MITIKRILSIIMVMLATFGVSAQVQQGIVRTIGRPNQPGQALNGVTIRVRGTHNAVVTNANGNFEIMLTGKSDGDAFVLQQVQKQGYELRDRSILGRQMALSSRVPIEILMVSTAQLQADKQRIERNAYRRAEQNYQSRLTTLEQQLHDSQLTDTQYQQELHALQENYERYLALISDLADRYARTDYDQLDSIDRVINICIEEGDMDRADSLIHTIFDPETVLERNRAAKDEIQQRMAFAQSIIDKATADREAILRDMDYARRVAVLCENLAQEYMAQGNNQQAMECLEQALRLHTILHGEDSEEAARIKHIIDGLKDAN